MKKEDDVRPPRRARREPKKTQKVKKERDPKDLESGDRNRIARKGREDKQLKDFQSMTYDELSKKIEGMKEWLKQERVRFKDQYTGKGKLDGQSMLGRMDKENEIREHNKDIKIAMDVLQTKTKPNNRQ